jgi:hypothetical protein
VIPAKQLLNEIAISLRTVIAPALAEPYPKTQAYMAAVILEFVARQVDERVDIADGKQAALTALFRELEPLDGGVGHSGDVAPSEAGLCQLVERLYAERDRLGEPAFTAANQLVRGTLRKLLDQDLMVAGKAEA